MTANERLVAYMSRKAEIIGMPEFFKEEDAGDIMSWDSDKAELTLSKIDLSGDATSCPWCISTGLDCINCGYGKRNGKCEDDKGNRYDAAVKKVERDCFYNLSTAIAPSAGELAEILGKTEDSLVKNN